MAPKAMAVVVVSDGSETGYITSAMETNHAAHRQAVKKEKKEKDEQTAALSETGGKSQSKKGQSKTAPLEVRTKPMLKGKAKSKTKGLMFAHGAKALVTAIYKHLLDSSDWKGLKTIALACQPHNENIPETRRRLWLSMCVPDSHCPCLAAGTEACVAPLDPFAQGIGCAAMAISIASLFS